MRRYFIPSSSGDFRLEAAAEDKSCSLLTVVDPSAEEVNRLDRFLKEARKRDWCAESVGIAFQGGSLVKLAASLVDVASLLTPEVMPGRGVLTVVRSEGGKIVAVSEAGLADAEKQAEEKADSNAAAAPAVSASVRRPTHCCPVPVPGPMDRASEVLQAFCTAEQWISWIKNGWLVCFGQLSGHAYRLVHRHHPLAAQQGKICWDLVDDAVLHFHLSFYPPAEEVLSAKLILEHREPWLRNSSTCLGAHTCVFPEPDGLGGQAGIADASFSYGIAEGLPFAFIMKGG